MKTMYLIRHAPTEANLNGSMLKNYEATHILNFDVLKWQNTYKDIIKYVDGVFTSETVRAKETANALFPFHDIKTLNYLNEFDCSGLGDKKFWEITETEFNDLVDLTADDMQRQVKKLFDWFVNGYFERCACVSHGMFIRAVCDIIQDVDYTPYTVINSENTKIANLDVVQIDWHRTNDGQYEIANCLVYPYSKPVNHKEA